jgi:hypothetical protein
LEKDPNHSALKELHEMVRTVGLAEKLGIDSGNKEASRPTIGHKQQVEQLRSTYPKGQVPREETNKVAFSMLQVLHPEHARIIAEKKQVPEIAANQANKISAPTSTPSNAVTEAKKKGDDKGRG